jgi:3-oxoacyl-[acyl-carrier-protein] synthase-3
MSQETTGPAVGIVSYATYLPETIQDAAYISSASGIPEAVVVEKLGIRQKRRASRADQTSAMAIAAARKALARADCDPLELDLVLYSGSMHKDFYVWSAACRIQEVLGAKNAYAFELAALCTTNVLALKVARDLMTADPRLRTVLICGGHRTADLINFKDPASRFLYNLSDGGSAMLLRRDYGRNRVLGSAFLTDGSQSENVVIPAGGTREPTSEKTLAAGKHTFTVVNPPALKETMDRISEEYFVRVVRQAVEISGARPEEIAFLALNHMKPSMHRHLLNTLGLTPEQSVYLEDYGHIGAPDQVLALELAEYAGKLHTGDLIVLASAGLGFTWGATAVRWGI